MSMTKQQKIGASCGGAFALCALALGWFLYSAYADHQAALEGDAEEGIKGLNDAKAEHARYHSQSDPFPSTEAIAAVKANKEAYSSWKTNALDLAARGDCPPPPDGLERTVFKQNLYEQVTKMQNLPGGVVGRICASTFQFGFEQYLGEAGGTPEQKDLPKLYAQLTTITNVVDLFAKSGVLEVRAFERLENKDEAEENNSRNAKNRSKGGKKSAKDEVGEAPKRYDYRIEYAVRASGFVKVLNGLAKSPRFYVVSEFGFEHEGDSLKARLDRVATASTTGEPSHGRRGRGREKKEQEVADNGFVTNPETDSPILVRMKLSVYDFGKGGARADADEADDAPAPSKKEGK
ncbi:MAG: Amuc_1100 family pilus-like protein [Kiritimatiellae bacterium]|nr:Amuc_1100 family pilus-like protein [Kiritimatiellia bacterium]